MKPEVPLLFWHQWFFWPFVWFRQVALDSVRVSVFVSTRVVMSKITMLRLLITQRLTAAAEEIFSVFGQTIAELEDEISRVRLENARNRRRAELSARPQVVLRGGGVRSVGGAAGGERKTVGDVR